MSPNAPQPLTVPLPPPFSWQCHYSETLAHYVMLAQAPGWRQYVWHQVTELAKSREYAAMPAQVTQAVKSLDARQHVPGSVA